MFKKIILLAAAITVADVCTAQAQSTTDNGSHLVWNATSPGSLATRRPGLMVNDGISRHNDALNFAFTPPDITETGEELSLPKQIKIIAIQTLFDQLNAALLAFDNLIRAQAGFAPFVPTPITPRTSNSLLDGTSSTTGGLPDLSGLTDLIGSL